MQRSVSLFISVPNIRCEVENAAGCLCCCICSSQVKRCLAQVVLLVELLGDGGVEAASLCEEHLEAGKAVLGGQVEEALVLHEDSLRPEGAEKRTGSGVLALHLDAQ